MTDTYYVPMLREIRSDAEELCGLCKHHGLNVSRHLLTGTKTDSVFLNMNKNSDMHTFWTIKPSPGYAKD